MIAAALILLLIPVAWSVLIQLIRQLAVRRQTVLHDLAEKAILTIMLLPVIAGGLCLAVARLIKAPLIKAPLLNQPFFDDMMPTAVPTIPHKAPDSPDYLTLGVYAVLIVYAIGVAFALWRVWQAHSRLARIVKTARSAGDGVLLTDAHVTAFAWGNRRIVLPAVLHDVLSASELALIIAHERAHQKRRDPESFLTLSLIEALFWFNPLFARQANACRLAAELACDSAVVGDAPAVRKIYARTLIMALRHTQADALSCVPAMFSSPDSQTYRLRLGQIMKRPARPNKAMAWIAAAFVLAAPVVTLQMAFAHGHALPAIPATASPQAAATSTPVTATGGLFNGVAFIVPVDGQLSERFGMRKNPSGGEMAFHQGIDFAAPIGTPVKAAADGTVSFVGDRPGYGMMISISHANGLTSHYAHLSAYGVKSGDSVTAGQTIGAVGNTGKGTGPHLHLEIWQDGKPADPAVVLDLAVEP